MSSEQIEGRRPVLEALLAGRPIDELMIASGARVSGALAEIAGLARRHGIPVRELPRRELESRSRTRNPQGVIALARAFDYAKLEELMELAGSTDEPPLLVALDGVTDPQNLGALARSAEAAGAHGLIIPRRRAAGIGTGAERASAGALEHLRVAQVANLARALESLKERGVWIVALDSAAEQTIYEIALAVDPICLVIGGESGGVSHLVKERADVIVRIPMSGKIGSLNASAAGAVALFEIRRRRMG